MSTASVTIGTIVLMVIGLLLYVSTKEPVAQTGESYEVEKSTKRDADGLFVEPEPITVTWDAEITAITPMHTPLDDDVLQEWYIPVTGGWLRFTFERTVPGEYALRWRESGQTGWSPWESCTITLPDKAKHVD